MNRIQNLLKSGTIVFADAEYIHEMLSLMVRPAPTHYKEVTQIGATKYIKGKEMDIFNMRVRPEVMGPKLTDKEWAIYRLITKVSKEEVMNPLNNTFIPVWNNFMKFVGSSPIVIMLCDREVYKWNFKLLGYDRDSELNNMDFIILKSLLIPEHQKYVSGELYKLIKIRENEIPEMGKPETLFPVIDNTHDALFDARSMALYCSNYDRIRFTSS